MAGTKREQREAHDAQRVAPEQFRAPGTRPDFFGETHTPEGPLAVVDTHPHYPIGGSVGVNATLAIPNYSRTVPPTLTSVSNGNIILAQWNRPTCRRVTVVVRAQTGPFNNGAQPFAGIAARITWADHRGSHSVWKPAPCIVTLQANYVRVEATLCSVPFNRLSMTGTIFGPPLSLTNFTSQPFFRPSLTSLPTNFQSIAYATITEGGEGSPGSDLITAARVCMANSPLFSGSAIVDSVILTNTGTNPVIMCVADENGQGIVSGAVYPGIVNVIVPGQTSREVFPGTVQVGLSAWGIAALAGSTAEDPNDSLVFADVFGTILQVGS